MVKQVLGEIIPPPPPVVPELPHDEATSERPLREMLAKHREHALCSACHAKIDSFGLAFEGYGPVGNARKTDLAGRPVDTAATYPSGKVGVGVDQPVVVALVQADAGFVEHVHDARQARADLGGEPDAL